MDEEPTVDGRRSEDVLEHARSIAPYYTDRWDPEGDDTGAVLLELFAELAEDVVERLDQAPEKHRISFLDAMGFDREPPQPAELPLVFDVADDAGRNVSIPAGIRATADGDDGEQVFRLDDAFEATPASIVRAYSVNPETDQIFEHWGPLSAGDSTRLFRTVQPDEDDLQQHALYVGDDSRLDLGPGASIQVTIDTDAEPGLLQDELVWEYFGEKEVDGETETGWHAFPASPDLAVIQQGRYSQIDESFDTLRMALASRGYRVMDAEQTAVIERFREVLRDASPSESDAFKLWVWAYDQIKAMIEQPPWRDGSRRGDKRRRRKPIKPDLFPYPPETPRGLYRVIHLFFRHLFEELAGREPTQSGARLVVISSLFDYLLDDLATSGTLTSSIEPRDTAELERLVTVSVARYAVDAGLFEDVAPSDPNEPVRLTLVTDGTITEEAVDGAESRWIRCRVPSDRADSDPFSITIGSSTGSDSATDGDEEPFVPPIQIGSTAQNLSPERLLSNDVPQPSDDGGIRPFGDWPRIQDAFYLASGDVFTKAGTTAMIEFHGSFADDQDPADSVSLSWEYYDGDGWSRLDGVDDDTSALLTDGTVEFVVPNDLEATTVSGHEDHWVRVRLVGGEYGGLSASKDEDAPTETWKTIREFDEPAYETVSLSYDDRRGPEHVLAENNLEFGPNLVEVEREWFEPFQRAPDDVQTLYLGFDEPLHGGPITLLFTMADVEYPESFHPRMRWEYCTDPDRDEWAGPSVRDGSSGLTERGIVSLALEEQTSPTRRFGEQYHWIRARVSRDQFGPSEETPTLPPREPTPADAPDPCSETVETEPPAGLPRRHRPTLTGIYPNAGWARNVRTVTDELLGSSDGSQAQTFVAADDPVVDPAVWVDERNALGPDRRRELADADPDGVDPVRNEAGELLAFWVRWSRVSNLLESGPDDRHYTLDSVAGEITFGDGTRGKIPPIGSDNVRVSYTTGGGEAGNVNAGAVDGLRRSLAFVDGVRNPVAADGGADAESTAAVGERAPKALRDRGRAVTAVDYERIAMDAARRLALVRCLPGMDRYGRYRPGWVTLLIVPHGPDEKPTPSATLKRQVEREVGNRAPVSLVDGTDQLVVRGPSYVAVSVDLELVASGTMSLTALEETATDAISSFLDPLSGGPDGDGWEFGRLPCPSDVYALIEGLDGVDHVVDLVLQFEGTEGVHTVRRGDPTPGVSADVLVHSGTHEVLAHLERPTRVGGA